MVQIDLYSELKKIKEQMDNQSSAFARHWREIDRWRKAKNYSSNEFNNSYWNMRHNELTCAFLYASMKELEEKEKTIRLLYGSN